MFSKNVQHVYIDRGVSEGGYNTTVTSSRCFGACEGEMNFRFKIKIFVLAVLFEFQGPDVCTIEPKSQLEFSPTALLKRGGIRIEEISSSGYWL